MGILIKDVKYVGLAYGLAPSLWLGYFLAALSLSGSRATREPQGAPNGWALT